MPPGLVLQTFKWIFRIERSTKSQEPAAIAPNSLLPHIDAYSDILYTVTIISFLCLPHVPSPRLFPPSCPSRQPMILLSSSAGMLDRLICKASHLKDSSCTKHFKNSSRYTHGPELITSARLFNFTVKPKMAFHGIEYLSYSCYPTLKILNIPVTIHAYSIVWPLPWLYYAAPTTSLSFRNASYISKITWTPDSNSELENAFL